MAKLETVVIGFKSKFGFKVGDTWYNPRKPLSVDQFEKGKTYTVLTEPYEKNGVSSVNVLQIVDDGAAALAGVGVPKAPAPSSAATPETGSVTTEKDKDVNVRCTNKGNEYIKMGFGNPMSLYEIELDRRISRAGIIQAAAQSPALGMLPVKNVADIAKAAKELADEMLLWAEL
jgi:hypothetical protein